MADELDDSVDGATEMVGAATIMVAEDNLAELVGATDTITATDKVQLAGLPAAAPAVKAREEAKRPSPALPPGRKARKAPTPFGGTTVTREAPGLSEDPHDQPTRLIADLEAATQLTPGTGSSPARGQRSSGTAAPHRAATQNTIPRAMVDDTRPDMRLDDTARRRLDDTRPTASAKKTLGGYKVTGVLASGQMGVVYRGEHPTPRRGPVAIKSVQSALTSNPAVVARFFAESIVLARIDHPNVVRFHDFGYDAQGSAYLVMELLDGETLTNRLARERKLDISTATDIALQITFGLAAAHKQGVIHRDIKPDNVFLCNGGTVKLLDFGVAKLDGQGPTHTLQGDLLGTAAYMAPEQGRSASESDVRSDLYSVGCVLFEMVCGVVPYPGTLVETLIAHQTAERPPARALNPEVSAELDAIIDKLLARDPADRPQTAVELIKMLTALDSTTERPIRRLGARPSIERAGPGRGLAEQWAALRAWGASIKARIADEPIALGLLITVLVLLVVLVARR